MPAGSAYGAGGYGIGAYGGDPIGSRPIDYYLGLITSQYQNSPNFLALVTALLEKLDDVTACALSIDQAFDLNAAVGVQLDTLGLILGASRTLPFQPTSGSAVLGDSDYRTLLRAKVALNQWSGQIDAIQPLWQQIFPGGTIVIDDGQNMAATVILAGSFTSIVKEMITNGLIVPRPAGVLYNYTFAALPILGFDLSNAFVAGFDTGKWS